jgi:signal transduction histidine kinase/CheY-like chemotaxis protein
MTIIDLSEQQRIQAVRAANILDTARETAFDELVKLAASICQVPIALISIVDEDRQWFKASVGLAVCETSREVSFCTHAIKNPHDLLEVVDSMKDERFKNNPLVIADPHIRFYLGCPLVDAQGFALGTLCVIDYQPRQLLNHQRESLQLIARQIMRLMSLRNQGKNVAIWHDIAEKDRHQAQLREQLQESVRRFDLVASGADIGIWETRLDPLTWEKNINAELPFYWSPRIAHLLGYQPGEFPPRLEPWLNALHPDDVAATLSAVNDCLAFGVPYNVEYRLKTKQDIYRWFHATGEAERDEQGRPVRMAGSMADITGRKNVEQLVEHMRSRLLSAINAIDSGFVMFDAEGYVVLANQKFAGLYGFASEQIPVGTHLSHLLAALEKTTALADMERPDLWVAEQMSPVTGATQEKEYFIAQRWMRISRHALPDGGFVALHTDVTALRQAIQTTEKARQLAESAAQTKSEFLATMSHELRTPMNGVIGMVSLLLETPLTEEQRDFAQTARSCGDNLLTLINDILDFTKIESGQLDLEQIAFSPRLLAEESVALLAEQAHSKGVEILCEIGSNVPRKLIGDPTRLRQVIVNLVGNAIKFTEKGEVVLSIFARPAAQANQMDCDIVVRDTGIGISFEQRNRLFKPFTQADSSTTRKYGGTGLGLVICQRLIGLMGGHITLDSEIGKGSTFTCHVPFLIGEDDAPALTHLDLVGQTVLIIAGHPTNRRILREQLLVWGMHCQEAGSAQDAVPIMMSQKPALTVIDNDVPGGALEAGQHLRKHQHAHQHQIPMILMTSTAHRGMAAKAQSAGFTGFLTKPVRQQQLFDCFVMVFDQACRAAEQPQETSKLFTRHSLQENKRQARVLVVEDNEINRQVAVMFLSKMGYRCDVAVNGMEAVEAIKQTDYQLVFMDCQMPVLDGFGATKYIRLWEGEQKHTRIIALTANALQPDRDKCLAAGMDDYISKPIRQQELTDVIQRVTQPASAVNNTTSNQPTTAALALIDADILRALRTATGSETVRTVVTMLRDDLPNIINDLQSAMNSGDSALMMRLAHRLKGSCGTLGLLHTQQCCQEMEESAREQKLIRAHELAHDIAQQLTDLVPKLEQHPVLVELE